MLKGNLMFGQSGGPTSVINSSAAGVFIEALQHADCIEKVYGAHHGIVGILNEDFFDMGQEDPNELLLLKETPSSALGSCRYKLADYQQDPTDYQRILEVFKKYNIRYFFYNGGNDSMDTCNKVSKFMQENGYECRVIGVPKTIDNDLAQTDHCPGFASAARYIATTMMELHCDSGVYDKDQVTIVEIMGRHAGWLTAASSLASLYNAGPDLIYVPERAFDLEKFIADVDRVRKTQGKVLVAISEGIHNSDGVLIAEAYGESKATDSFGHKQLGGTSYLLANIVGERLGCKVRAIELSLMQRCAAHLASLTDVEESFASGREAVRAALEGTTDVMIGFGRKDCPEYKMELIRVPLSVVANTEKKLPEHYINAEANGITKDFADYALPLIQGVPTLHHQQSLPRFAQLKYVQAGRR